MYENVRKRLEWVRYQPDTKTWDLRYSHGISTPLTNSKMRGIVRRMLVAAPGPLLMHTQLTREVRAIMQELCDRKEPA